MNKIYEFMGIDERIMDRMRLVYECYPLTIESNEMVFSLSEDLFITYNRNINILLHRTNDDEIRGTLYFRGIEVRKIDISKGRIMLGRKL